MNEYNEAWKPWMDSALHKINVVWLQ